MKTSELIPVKFYEDTIYSVDYNGEQYTPVRPIIINLGMSWSGQATKLRNNKDRWRCADICTPSNSGNQEYVCIPVRKVAAFLATIQANRVRKDLQEKLLRYQNECDDVLNDYHTKGRAINPRYRAETKAEPQPEHKSSSTRKHPLSSEQLANLDKLLLEKMSCWNPTRHQEGRDAFHRAIKNSFKVAKVEEIPEDKFDELMQFIQSKYNHPYRIGVPQDVDNHCPNIIDDFLQFMLYRVNGILEDAAYIPEGVAKHNIIIQLTMITSVLGAVFPEEMQWLRLGWIRDKKQVECLSAELEEQKRVRQTINDKKTATAMGKLGGLTKKFDKVQKENEDLKIRLEKARKSLCGAVISKS